MHEKFIIVTQPRTGSTMLVQALDKHSKITCKGEIFLHTVEGVTQERPEQKKWGVMKELFSHDGIRGFKMMLVQRPRGIYEWMVEEDVKVIYLWREDVVRQVISMALAKQTGKWGHFKFPGKNTLDPVGISMMVDGAIAGREKFENTLLPHLKHITISYEELVNEDGNEVSELPEKATRKLLNFLGTGYERLPISMKKQGMANLKELVSNYEEVMAYLKEHNRHIR